METKDVLQTLDLLAQATLGFLTAMELNQTHRLPVLRAHVATVRRMIAEGRGPTDAELDTITADILKDIDAINQRAEDARG